MEKKHWAIFIVFVVLVFGFAISNFFIDWLVLLGISERPGPVVEMPAGLAAFEINILYIVAAVFLGVIFISSFFIGLHEHRLKALKEQKRAVVEKDRAVLEKRAWEKKDVKRLDKEEMQELKVLTPVRKAERFMTKQPRVPTYLKAWKWLRRPKRRRPPEKKKVVLSDVNERIGDLLEEVKRF